MRFRVVRARRQPSHAVTVGSHVRRPGASTPFHTPVFLVTNEQRAPWQRLGGTTFHFVNEGIESALSQAPEAAGVRDVRIAGGAADLHRASR